jgi:hypothetical protein
MIFCKVKLLKGWDRQVCFGEVPLPDRQGYEPCP